MSSSPEYVYARELFRCGWGHPLWQPEAAENDVEVEIGDVGYLDKGAFYRLFNACRDEDDVLNYKPQDDADAAELPRVPEGFERLATGLQPRKMRSAINAGPYYSKSVMRVGANAQGTT